MADPRSEYDPDELPVIEPDEDPEYEPDDLPAAPATMVRAGSSTDGAGGADFEYRTETLTIDQIADGRTLAERLAAGTAEGWHFVQVIDAGDNRVVLSRKLKKPERERRSVGFAPPSRS